MPKGLTRGFPHGDSPRSSVLSCLRESFHIRQRYKREKTDRYQRVPAEPPEDYDRYDVQWRRTALIICDQQRPGSWRDMMTMFEFFERNGFECKSEGRPTSQRLKATLREFRASLSNGYVSCFILVIMAHGVQGRIVLPVYKEDYYDYADYARECKNPPKMELAEIFQMFDNRQCPAMREKPKLFIVQACRGDQCHSMGYSSLLCDSSGYPSPVHAHARLPTMSDYMIVYAAQPGKVAFRHPDHGSPLFTVLLDVVEEEKTQHMREIFIKVTNILKERSRRDWALVGELNPPDNSLHVEDGLSKKWYLFHT